MRSPWLLKGCTIEACDDEGDKRYIAKFQLLLKGCTIEAVVNGTLWLALSVSVVVERMYD